MEAMRELAMQGRAYLDRFIDAATDLDCAALDAEINILWATVGEDEVDEEEAQEVLDEIDEALDYLSEAGHGIIKQAGEGRQTTTNDSDFVRPVILQTRPIRYPPNLGHP